MHASGLRRLPPAACSARSLLERRPVIAVSATLGGEAPFAPLASRLGFDPDAEPGSWGERDDDGGRHSATGRGYVSLVTPSSFAWSEQGILYVGQGSARSRPRRDAWLDAAGERLVRLVNAAGGRALVLCTSRGERRPVRASSCAMRPTTMCSRRATPTSAR